MLCVCPFPAIVRPEIDCGAGRHSWFQLLDAIGQRFHLDVSHALYSSASSLATSAGDAHLWNSVNSAVSVFVIRADRRCSVSPILVDIRSGNEQFNLAYLSPGRGELRPVAANSFLTVNLSQRFRQGIGRGDSYVRFNPCSFPAIV